MKFTDFYVVDVIHSGENTPNREIIYTDDIEDTIKNEYKNDMVMIINESNYTINDYIEIVESLLEDANAHKYTNKISGIIDIMRTVFISEKAILDFVRIYTHDMFDRYGS